MDKQYFITLNSPVNPDHVADIAGQIAQQLGQDKHKLEQLIMKGPGPLTKPVAHNQAQRIEQVFKNAGADVSLTLFRAEDVLNADDDNDDWSALPHVDLSHSSIQDPTQTVFGQAHERAEASGEDAAYAAFENDTADDDASTGDEVVAPASSGKRRMISVIALLILVIAAAALYFMPGVKDRFLRQAPPSYEAGVSAFEAGDYERAYQQWLPLAEAGDSNAQHQLGLLYASGQGVTQNSDEALRWLSQAAEGDSDVQYELGNLYYNGSGLEQNFEQAANWFEQAAQNGDARAQYQLGLMYINSQGVPFDTDKASEYLAQAEAQGVSEASEYLQQIIDMKTRQQELELLKAQEAANLENAREEMSERQAWLASATVFDLAREATVGELTAAVIGGVDVSVRDVYGQTPLMYAAGSNTADVVQVLIDAGANVNAQSGANWTALMYAARAGNLAVAETLIANGADVLRTNSDGQTALLLTGAEDEQMLSLLERSARQQLLAN